MCVSGTPQHSCKRAGREEQTLMKGQEKADFVVAVLQEW